MWGCGRWFSDVLGEKGTGQVCMKGGGGRVARGWGGERGRTCTGGMAAATCIRTRHCWEGPHVWPAAAPADGARQLLHD